MPRKKRQQRKQKKQPTEDDLDILLSTSSYSAQVFVIRHWLEENQCDDVPQLISSSSSVCSNSSSTLKQFSKHYFADLNSKKKRSKRIKRSTNQESKKTKSQNKVSFSSVSINEYKRGLSADAIPNDGSNYPLGLTNTIIRSYIYDNIDDFEKERQEILHNRLNSWTKKMKKKKSKQNNNETKATDMLASSGTLETRQWDYKNTDHSNPLFKPLKEHDRKQLFSRDLANTKCKTRTQPPRKSKVQLQDNLPFTLHEIDQIQNSIAEIHKERSYNTQRGCNCHMQQTCHKTLKKKVKHYSMHKLLDELNKRNLLNSSKLSRDEMEILLLHELENHDIESCCKNDCECKLNGVECHVLYCNCCDLPTKKNKKLKEMIEMMDKNDLYKHVCGNPFGIYTVDEYGIQLHYDRILRNV